jgi:hypothetical protein
MAEPIELDAEATPATDDSSQDPAQPVVGPAIQFQKLIVPDDEPVVDSGEYGEILHPE